eukprot:scaffold1588_cov408-Prasinococcus_capsulatus_cf.AAC.12
MKVARPAQIFLVGGLCASHRGCPDTAGWGGSLPQRGQRPPARPRTGPGAVRPAQVGRRAAPATPKHTHNGSRVNQRRRVVAGRWHRLSVRFRSATDANILWWSERVSLRGQVGAAKGRTGRPVS